MSSATATLQKTAVPEVITMKVGGLTGVVFTGGSASTGYSWHFTVDNSGVYQTSRTVIASPNALIGQPDLEVLAIAAVREGHGMLEAGLYPPASGTPVESHKIKIVVAGE